MPSWINSLDKGHWLKEAVFSHIRSAASHLTNLRQINTCADEIALCDQVTESRVKSIDLGSGSAVISDWDSSGSFFKIIGEATGLTN